MEQTSRILEQLESKLKYQWSLVSAAHDADELASRRAKALETYAQLNKYKVQIGMK